MRSGSQAWVELTCTFQYSLSESQQVDLKWYYSEEEEPFLQWVPSISREPQIRGNRFRSGMTVRQQIKNTTVLMMVEQVLRIERPTTHLSGDYTCRVATFTHEEKKSHTMTVFGNKKHIFKSLLNLIISCSRPRCWSYPEVLRGEQSGESLLSGEGCFPRASSGDRLGLGTGRGKDKEQR